MRQFHYEWASDLFYSLYALGWDGHLVILTQAASLQLECLGAGTMKQEETRTRYRLHHRAQSTITD